MSHFSVLVVTNTSSRDGLEEALWPFHEFECTGEDRHIQDIDITEEAREEYQEADTRVYRDNAGLIHDAYDDRFYRAPTPEETAKIGPIAGTGAGNGISWTSKDWGDGRGYRTKVHYVPDGYEDLRVAVAERESFTEWAAGYYGRPLLRFGEEPGDDHKYGYILVNEDGDVVRIVKRTNPNAKWDWWSVGGRFSNRLVGDGRKCDHAQFGSIDLDDMRRAERERRASAVEAARAEVASGKLSEGMARYFYGERVFDPGYIDREQAWTFAVLKDGKWLQRGEMGWFGIVTNEEAPEDWDEAYRIVLASIRPDQHVWIVDCHI